MRDYAILNQIHTPDDLKKLELPQLRELADDIRHYLIDVVSANGGHLAPSLGVVELTIALHHVFRTPEDHLIWDVGHQAYPHKILTGRREQFRTIRQFRGLSGFTKRGESEYDHYTVGHSSTSLSLAIGDAIARDHHGKNYHIIPVIGDGAMTSGMAYEAMNLIGGLKKSMVIVLNDNKMSISPNVGAIAKYLNRIISSPAYNRMRKKWYNFLISIPRFGKKISNVAQDMEYRMKHLFIPGMFFEELGIRYIGPVDGHDLEGLIRRFNEVKNIENGGPILVHVITKKGYGYKHAEENAVTFHGLGPFEKESGAVIKQGTGLEQISYSAIFGNKLVEMARSDSSIVAITAAMCAGTGLSDFAKQFPDRFYDVGIAEQNAVTSAAAMAANGLKPYVAIYSTFLQRAYDQVIHDVALMNLPVKFIIDRGGVVGEDGPTHHGVFDISYLRPIPNLVLLSPRDGAEFQAMLDFMNHYNDGPIAIRFPRGGDEKRLLGRKLSLPIELGKAETLYEGHDMTIFTYGPFYEAGLLLRQRVMAEGLDVGLVNLRFIKPLDESTVIEAVQKSHCFVTMEDGSLIGGIADAIQSALPPMLRSKELRRIGYSDAFVSHGDKDRVLEDLQLHVEALASDLRQRYQSAFGRSRTSLKKVAN